MTVDLQPGETLPGGYRLIARLGEGAYGVVYRARTTDGRAVAVKLLRAESVGHGRHRARFEREAALLRRIAHPGVARLVDVGACAAGPFLVEELIVGLTLRDALLQRDVFEAPLAAELVAQVLEALQATHLAGVVHRDVKPDNIMLTLDADGRMRARLIDFGLARPFRAPLGSGLYRTAAGIAVGTPAFAAPEQIRARDIGPSADQFAAALTFCALVCGRARFKAVFRRIRGEEGDAPWVPEEVPEPVVPVIERALASDPANRFPDAATFAEALRDALRHTRVVPTRATRVWARRAELQTAVVRVLDAERVAGATSRDDVPPPPARPAPRPSRWPIWVAASGVLTAASITVWAVLDDPPPPMAPEAAVDAVSTSRAGGADAPLPDERVRNGPDVSRARAVEGSRVRAARPVASEGSPAAAAPSPTEGPSARREQAPPRTSPDDEAAGRAPVSPRRAQRSRAARRGRAQDPPDQLAERGGVRRPRGPDAQARRHRAEERAPTASADGSPSLERGVRTPAPDLVATGPASDLPVERPPSLLETAAALDACDCSTARRGVDALAGTRSAAADALRARFRRECLVLGAGCRVQ